ncbi:MAG: polysaccharide deacetylase family protein [Rhodospirillales bacterium]|nr:polysaccharide deacetylase family protein [Rhodospirillales bacterium]
MLNPESWSEAKFPADGPPLLAVVVDTEEEFDWALPHGRENTSVASVRHQERAHKIFAEFGIKPTYVVDYAVASQTDGYRPLGELFADGLCEIGAHLHPWVNPPFEEMVNYRNSYPGNLPRNLEKAKLEHLTLEIENRFGVRPTVYRAGRYGVGQASAAILEELGYLVDSSVVPYTNFSRDDGPDFSGCPSKPYWFGGGQKLLEIPVTAGFAGLLGGGFPGKSGRNLYKAVSGPLGLRFHLPGVLARSGVLERIRLTPEGVSHAERCRLTRALLAGGHRVFTFNYHSPSLEPGNTPYVRTPAELDAFLDDFRRYFDYFLGDLGGCPATLGEIGALAADGVARTGTP